MAYLGVISAFRARLEGKGREFVPDFPVLDGSEGETPPAFKNTGSTQVPNYLTNSKDVCGGHINVPVYAFDISGRSWNDVYPAITLEVVTLEPRFDEYQERGAGAPYYYEPVLSSSELLPGDTQRTARLAKVREIEQPMDFFVQVKAYARDPVLSALLVDYVYDTLRPRDFIRVPLRDGRYADWDLFSVDYTDLDNAQPAAGGVPGMLREYLKVFMYRVEGYLDNTDTTRLVSLIRKLTISSNLK